MGRVWTEKDMAEIEVHIHEIEKKVRSLASGVLPESSDYLGVRRPTLPSSLALRLRYLGRTIRALQEEDEEQNRVGSMRHIPGSELFERNTNGKTLD